MSANLIGLIGGVAVGVAVLGLAFAFRTRRGRTLISGVDWTRVSDPEGLAQSVSLLTIAIAALIVLNTALRYAWPDLDTGLAFRHDLFALPMGVLLVAILFVKRRFHDLPAHNGRR